MRRTFFTILLLLVLAGCRTNEVHSTAAYPGQTAVDGSPVLANVQAENYGFFLFGFLPMWSGNPYRPNARLYITCRDYIKDDYNRMMMENCARRHGEGRLADYKSTEHFSGAYTLFVVWRKVLRSRAVWVGAPAK